MHSLGQPASWDSARSPQAADFMKQLLTYDKDDIDDRTITALKRFTLNPEFVPENVENVSKAAKGLCIGSVLSMYMRVWLRR